MIEMQILTACRVVIASTALLVGTGTANAASDGLLYACNEDRHLGWSSDGDGGGKRAVENETFFVRWIAPKIDGKKLLSLPQIEITRGNSTTAPLTLMDCNEHFAHRGAPPSYQDFRCTYDIENAIVSSYSLPTSSITFDGNFSQRPKSVRYVEFFTIKGMAYIAGGSCAIAP